MVMNWIEQIWNGTGTFLYVQQKSSMQVIAQIEGLDVFFLVYTKYSYLIFILAFRIPNIIRRKITVIFLY